VKYIAVAIIMLVVNIPLSYSTSLSYDANGNLVSGDGLYREYNSLNQLWRVRNLTQEGNVLLSYVYHPTEERVLIKNVSNPDGSWREAWHYISKEFQRKINQSGTFDFKYVYHENQLVAEVLDETIFHYPDNLGSSTVIADEEGILAERASYTPYGLPLQESISLKGYEGKEFDCERSELMG